MVSTGSAVAVRVPARRRRRPEMLDAYVIEEIKRRERDKSRDDRPAIELPVPPPVPGRPPERDDDEGRDRGVVIIDYSG
jgi:hypothetical protein